jgi:predicted RNA-binding Zn ribbon-like protein
MRAYRPTSKQGAPRWVWYGGRPSLDLVNTLRDREGGGVEYLREPADLADWLRAAGHGNVAAGSDALGFDSLGSDVLGSDVLGSDALAQVRELREAIDAGVRAAVTGQPFPPAALTVLNHWLTATAVGPPQLRLSGGVAELSSADGPRTVRRVLAEIAADAAELLGTGQRSRLRICPGPGCGGRFADDSPAGRRRWCSMAVCGNRNKAAAHRQAVRA